MRRRVIIAFGIFLACCPPLSALNPSLDINQYAHTAWRIKDGAFNGAISLIAQTPDGYLWLGTEFGLLRFDGVRSVPWNPPAGEHLPGRTISRLLVTRDGRLWIGTRAGLASWKDGRLAHYQELAGYSVFSLLEDRQGTIWAGAFGVPKGKLCAIRNDKVRCFGQDGTFGFGVLSLYENKEGLWAGTATGLWRWTPAPGKFYPAPDQPSEIQSLIEGDNGALWLAVRGGIMQLVNGKLEHYPLAIGRPFRPRWFQRDREGSLWIGTSDQGLLHLHQGKIDAFGSASGLSGDDIYSLFEDREGNIWVATLDGLDRFRDFAVPTISVKQGLSRNIVSSVLAAKDGSVWLGSSDGLNRWKDGQVTVYRKRDGLPDDSAHSLFQDGRGRVWVSTLHGIAYFEDGHFVPVRAAPGGIVHDIVEESAENIWINDQAQGLIHLIGEQLVKRIPWTELGHQDLAASLVPDRVQGGLWVGFYLGGLLSLKDDRVRASYSTADGLGEGRVTNLQVDRAGTLWAATAGGLSMVKNGRVATLSSKNGLPCDTVHWTVEDDDGSFWANMPCGLVHIARSELDAWSADPRRMISVAIFDSADGVRSVWSAGAYSPRVSKSRDGKLWFATLDGVSVVDPRHLPVNKLTPPVHIEQITADRKIYWQNFLGDASSSLRLPPLVRDLEIDYTALSLAAPEKNRLKYKLEGRDRDWQDVGNRRQAFYSDLAPRSYRFRVAASNNHGVWNEAGASIDFSVAPAYYQTSWFQTLCVGAFLALLWGLYRYRLSQIAREYNVRLEERVAERTRLARDLHDTLLQSFQGLMLRFQVVEEMLPPGKGKDELEKTLERADLAIAEGRTAVYDLRSSTTTTNDLAEAVRALGNELATPDAAAFRLVVEGSTRDLHPIIRDEIYRITREAVRNAFAHAQARHIEAEITYADRLFRLRIRDDGQGIAPAYLEEGRPGHYGLPGMRERAQQIGAALSIWSGAEAGTEIELSISGSIAYGTSAGRSLLGLFRRKAG